jgi:hypothetical protein
MDDFNVLLDLELNKFDGNIDDLIQLKIMNGLTTEIYINELYYVCMFI